MSFTFKKEMPSAEHLKELLPVPSDSAEIRIKRISEIEAVLSGKDNRILLIIGPCSADNEDSVCDYISRLASVQNEVNDKILLVPRVYTNKPRTTGEGYKGMMHQPDPNEAPNAFEGIKAIRQMHLRVLRETGFVSALILYLYHTFVKNLCVFRQLSYILVPIFVHIFVLRLFQYRICIILYL